MDPILDRWNQALKEIRAAGYAVREEWLDGGGGLCEFGGRKYFFSDQSLSLFERIDQAESALKEVRKTQASADGPDPADTEDPRGPA